MVVAPTPGSAQARQADEAAALRAEISRLDAALERETADLQENRDEFVRLVAAHDAGRAQRAEAVQEALSELELDRGGMEAAHAELAGARESLQRAETESEALEW